jgi:hypothetical protein
VTTQLELLDLPTAPERAISKSKFISGTQCAKLVWHQYNAKELIPPYDASQQAVFDQGHEVGRRARQLYAGGVLIERERWDIDGLLEDTAKALSAGLPLYEAAFLGGGAYAQIDILVPVEGGRWDIVEVKSSTSVKPVYVDDLALQRYAAETSGARIRNCHLAHIDRDYVRSAPIDDTKLFRIVDVTDQVAERLPDVTGRVEALASIIRQPSSPEVGVGPHCTKPHSCPMIPVCWPEGRVTRLVRGADRLAIHTATTESRQPYVNVPNVREFLDGLTYPLFFLDFETFGTAIPLLDGVRPYQQVPFQFSLHVRREPGGPLTHHSFLAAGAGDPRPQLLHHMQQWLEDAGSIVAYFAAFESGRLGELAREFPEHAEWIERVLARVVDLHAPFKEFHVYHPLQEGRTSLKAVLPALTGSGYEGMAIADGGAASLAFLRIAYRSPGVLRDVDSWSLGASVPGERQGTEVTADVAKVREDLEAYCRLDTLAMVRILDELERLAAASGLYDRLQPRAE